MNYENLVLGTISSDAFVTVNKKLAQKLGFLEAGLLGEMMALYRMCKQNDYFFIKDNEKWFYVTQPYIENQLGIKRAPFQTATKNLVKSGVILQKKLGIPAKNYYQINWEIITALYIEEDTEEKDEKEVKEEKSASKPAPLQGCMNHASKDDGNMQPRDHDSSNLERMNHATIRSINKNDSITNMYNNNYSLSLNSINNIDNVLTAFEYTERERQEIIKLANESNLVELSQEDIIDQARYMASVPNVRNRPYYFIEGVKMNLGRNTRNPNKKPLEVKTSALDHERMKDLLGIK